MSLAFLFFSSRRRHTRWPRDWSSDVCSSDLTWAVLDQRHTRMGLDNPVVGAAEYGLTMRHPIAEPTVVAALAAEGEIGRASCRERVEMSVAAVSRSKRAASICTM